MEHEEGQITEHSDRMEVDEGKTKSRDRRTSSSSASKKDRDYKDRESSSRRDSDRSQDRKERARDDDDRGSNDDSGGGGGDIELDIDATNKIRISLGLKPLNLDSDKKKKDDDAKKVKELEENEKERKTQMLAAKIQKAKEDRAYKSRIGGKSIAEEAAEEEDDEGAAAWVRRSRTVHTVNAEKEKQLALKRAQEIEELERSAATGKDLEGTLISHDLSNVEEPVILTVKDTYVIKGGVGDELNDEDDELENIKIAEQEKLQRNKDLKKKKPIYNVFDQQKSILAQYDEPQEKEKMVITAGGKVAGGREAEDIKMKLQDMSMYSLNLDKNFASEYYTQDEMAKFKKPKAKTSTKKKLRKKKESIITELENEMEGEANRGSRDSVKAKAEQAKQEDQAKKEKNYAKALEKATENSKIVFDNEIDKNEDEKFIKPTDSRRKGPDSKAIAQLVLERAKKKEEEEIESLKGAINAPTMGNITALYANSTAEFINRVQPIEEILKDSKKKEKREKKKAVKMEIDEQKANEDIDEHEKMLRETLVKQNRDRQPPRQREQFVEVTPETEKQREEEDIKMKEAEEEDKSDEEEDDQDTDEPVVSGGMAAALQLLKKKGITNTEEELDTSYGRRTDKTIEEEYVRVPGFMNADPKIGKDVRIEYLDDNGRQLTPKEAFRHLSYRFHGMKPGKGKQEKRMRQHEIEMKKKRSGGVLAALSMEQKLEKTQTPYLTLTGTLENNDDDEGSSKKKAKTKK